MAIDGRGVPREEGVMRQDGHTTTKAAMAALAEYPDADISKLWVPADESVGYCQAWHRDVAKGRAVEARLTAEIDFWKMRAADRYDQLTAACRALGVDEPAPSDASMPSPEPKNARALVVLADLAASQAEAARRGKIADRLAAAVRAIREWTDLETGEELREAYAALDEYDAAARRGPARSGAG